MNVAIACGGTGGHLFPGLAVAEVLHARGHSVLVFISEKEIDALAIKGHDAFRFEKLRSIGMPALFSPAIFAFTIRFSESVIRCRTIFDKFKPDAVLGMGGFTSTGPILAARMRGTPTFIHESNAIPGKANRITARVTDVVLLGFEECASRFPKNKTIRVTGTPVRASLKQPVDKQAVYQKFGLSPDKTTVLVMGGSQGAHGINEAVGRALPALAGKPFQFLHLTGLKDDTVMREKYASNEVASCVEAFHHEMQELYAVANIAIARSGAASLTELSHFGIPSILIPYPYAAEDHQTYNAEIFSKAGAAVLLKENEVNGEALAATLCGFLDTPGRLESMAQCSRQLAPDDAAEKVADVLKEFGKK